MILNGGFYMFYKVLVLFLVLNANSLFAWTKFSYPSNNSKVNFWLDEKFPKAKIYETTHSKISKDLECKSNKNVELITISKTACIHVLDKENVAIYINKKEQYQRFLVDLNNLSKDEFIKFAKWSQNNE